MAQDNQGSQAKIRKLEKKIYLTYHMDGLWDIFLGITMLCFAAATWLESIVLFAIMPAILFPTAKKTKESFARRRLGHVEFSPERRARENTGRMIMSVLLTASVVLGLLVFMAYWTTRPLSEWVRSLGLIPFGFVIAILLASAGAAYGIMRFIPYAFFVIVTFVAVQLTHAHPSINFLVPGGLFLLIGLGLLIRFVRKYPAPAVENGHE